MACENDRQPQDDHSEVLFSLLSSINNFISTQIFSYKIETEITSWCDHIYNVYIDIPQTQVKTPHIIHYVT